MRLILTRNASSFNGDLYLQQHGTAMGTHMAPSFANLFMGKLEQNFLSNQERQPLVWWRYTDDIFTIWTHGEPALQEFLESLNKYHTTIKFTATWSTKEVPFLDIQVMSRSMGSTQTCMSNPRIPVSTSTLTAATPSTVRTPSPIAKL